MAEWVDEIIPASVPGIASNCTIGDYNGGVAFQQFHNLSLRSIFERHKNMIGFFLYYVDSFLSLGYLKFALFHCGWICLFDCCCSNELKFFYKIYFSKLFLF